MNRDVEEARDRFLTGVVQHEPEVLDSLLRDADADLGLESRASEVEVSPLVHYRWVREELLRRSPLGRSAAPATTPATAARESFSQPGAIDRGIRNAVMGDPIPTRYASLHASLLAWQQRWNLTAPWCLDRALRCLEYQCRHPTRRPSLGTTEGSFRYRSVPEGRPRPFEFVFDHAGWNPGAVGRRAWCANTRQEFETALQAHADRVEAFVRERGLIPAPQHQEPLHYQWLVRFQVLNEEFSAIATGPPKRSADAVRHAVNRLASLLALPLRPSRKGRPPKEKRSAPSRIPRP